jgi:hypothetical protein
VNDNQVWNNTFLLNSSAGAIWTDTLAGGAQGQGNLVKNNLLLDFTWSGNRKLINWSWPGSSAGNEFKNNGIWAQANGANGAQATGTIATVSSVNASCTQLGVPFDLDGPTNGISDANLCPGSVTHSPSGFGFANDDLNAFDLRLHGTSYAVNAGTLTGMPARTGIHNALASAHGLPNYTRLQTTNIAASPDMGAYEVLLADGGFEANSLDAPWLSPIGDFTSICTPPAMSSTGSILGGRSLNLSTGPCFDALCFGCRSRFVQQTLTGLDTGRTYSLSGKWKLQSGTIGESSYVNFTYCEAPPCTALQCGIDDLAPCSSVISGLQGETISFVCPSFMIPSASSMTIGIVPCLSGLSMTLAIDDLELR